jgi:beta-aspartyl-peptidase (threonine type)
MVKRFAPVLIVHGGAGARALPQDRPLRRRALLAAARHGSEVLEAAGGALDAVIAAVVMMEDDPLFNAGYGSALNSDGEVEMDASLMVFPLAEPAASANGKPGLMGAGAVAGIRRVRNPVLLAHAVMTQTPHVLIIGAAAERLAGRAGIKTCRPEDLISDRARLRWQTYMDGVTDHGTVGAAALDCRGQLAAATSTGGITGKMPGRVGDSAIICAGTFAGPGGAASATGIGEAIMKAALCREAVRMLPRSNPARAASGAIEALEQTTGGEAGLIVIDRRGRLGFAHNAQAMDIATFTRDEGLKFHAL